MANIARFEKNEKLNGIEIYFKVYPIEQTRNSLKSAGWHWNHKKSCWYIKDTDESLEFVKVLCDTTIEDYQQIAEQNGEKIQTISDVMKKNAEKTKKNKFGVKVGDVFSMSWGYEQTNNNFFQVVALCGEQSVRVVEVVPTRIATDAISPMSADYTYDITKCVVKDHSMWIKDQEKGDIKRLKCFNKDGTCPQFYVTSYADAYLVSGDKVKVYESWYY